MSCKIVHSPTIGVWVVSWDTEAFTIKGVVTSVSPKHAKAFNKPLEFLEMEEEDLLQVQALQERIDPLQRARTLSGPEQKMVLKVEMKVTELCSTTENVIKHESDARHCC